MVILNNFLRNLGLMAAGCIISYYVYRISIYYNIRPTTYVFTAEEIYLIHEVIIYTVAIAIGLTISQTQWWRLQKNS